MDALVYDPQIPLFPKFTEAIVAELSRGSMTKADLMAKVGIKDPSAIAKAVVGSEEKVITGPGGREITYNELTYAHLLALRKERTVRLVSTVTGVYELVKKKNGRKT